MNLEENKNHLQFNQFNDQNHKDSLLTLTCTEHLESKENINNFRLHSHKYNTSSYFNTVTSSDKNLTQRNSKNSEILSTPLNHLEKMRQDLNLELEDNDHDHDNTYNYSKSPVPTLKIKAENFIKKRNDLYFRKKSEENQLINSFNQEKIDNNGVYNVYNDKLLISNSPQQQSIMKTEASLEKISITGYIIKNVIFQHVKYIITIINNYEITKIYRRYSEFLKLREMLVSKYIGVFVPSLPLKEYKAFNNKNLTLIEFRKKFLQIFLHEIQITYFFSESEEIKAFLDPKLENFPPENLLIQFNMKIQSEDFLIEEGLQISRIKLNNNYYMHQINTFICDASENKFLKETYRQNSLINSLNSLNIMNKSSLNYICPIKSYREISNENILTYINQIQKFSNLLFYKKNVLDKIQIVLNFLVMSQKDISNNNYQDSFLAGLIDFQKNFIFSLAGNRNFSEDFINNFYDENFHIKNEIFQKEKSENRNLYLLLKNMNDWIYKEIINLDSMIECLNSLQPFIHKVKTVFGELNKLHEKVNLLSHVNIESPSSNNENSSHSNSTKSEVEYVNFELKEKLESKLENLKEIIALNSFFVYKIEIIKYKNCRFEYFYNCLRFANVMNSGYKNEESKLYISVNKIIEMIERYMRENRINFDNLINEKFQD